MIGYISKIESMGGVDGPGIRTILFLQGCPARCAYCHNPELLACEGGRKYTVEEVVALALRYKAYYRNGGGVTFSGGEPTIQGQFVIECAKALKKVGINSVLDTGGFVFDPEVIDACDLVILDIKSVDEEEFRKLTGQPMDNTLKTLEYLKDKNKPFWIRQVIIGDYNDNIENITKLKSMAKGAALIELLPYHDLAKGKGAVKPDWLKVPDQETMDKLQAQLRKGKDIRNPV